jgi:hypothetical protein
VFEVPLKQVLWSECSGSQLQVQVLVNKGKKVALNLVNISGKLTDDDVARAPEWVENLMVAAYARESSILCRASVIDKHFRRKAKEEVESAHQPSRWTCNARIILALVLTDVLSGKSSLDIPQEGRTHTSCC